MTHEDTVECLIFCKLLDLVQYEVLTEKFSHRGNDGYDLLKLNDFQRPVTSYTNTFKALFCFQRLSKPS